MFDFLAKYGGGAQGSKVAAKERLQLVLIHDRTSLSPQLMETLREEILQVISKYMEIETAGLEVAVNRTDKRVALVANIPIRRVKELS